jgi:GNAT superfamily N-acetyltransferase
MELLADLWRRWGLLGLAGRVWSRSLGALVDPQVVLECEVEAGGVSFAPVPGYRYAKVAVSEGSAEAAAAASLLRVNLRERLAQDLFVVAPDAGAVAGCTWNDPPESGRAIQRGVAVDRRHRGHGLASSLLLFQARALAADGTQVVQYRTALGNRAARRMFHKAGARLGRTVLVLHLLRRRAWVIALPPRIDAWIRRGWERERVTVTASRRPPSDPTRTG